MEISIEVEIDAKINDVWHAWVTPEEIINWKAANITPPVS